MRTSLRIEEGVDAQVELSTADTENKRSPALTFSFDPDRYRGCASASHKGGD